MRAHAPFLLENRKFVSPEYIFGLDCSQLAGHYANNLGGCRVLVVTDPGIVTAGWTGVVTDALQKSGLEYCLFDTVTPNPRDFEVAAGVQMYKANDCDIIVAVGGGSVMDCAKGIGVLAGNGGNILDYEGVDKITLPIPPLICIPTTGGTSADVSQFSIILNTASKVKIAIISKAIVPDIALIDPRLLTTMSPMLTACTGVDALVHAFEAYVSNASSYITDLLALEAIDLIYGNLNQSLTDPNNLQVRGRVMQGSLLAGLAFSNASLGCVHAMAHSLGGMLDLPHGECNAILLDHVVAFNHEAAPERYTEIARIFHVTDPDSPAALCAAIRRFKQSVGIHASLATVGVTPGAIPLLAASSLHDPCMFTNPRRPGLSDIEAIFTGAL